MVFEVFIHSLRVQLSGSIYLHLLPQRIKLLLRSIVKEVQILSDKESPLNAKSKLLERHSQKHILHWCVPAIPRIQGIQ